MGAVERLKREAQIGLKNARWAGFFAQVKISHHARLINELLSEKPANTTMTGAAIGSALRAWAARSN